MRGSPHLTLAGVLGLLISAVCSFSVFYSGFVDGCSRFSSLLGSASFFVPRDRRARLCVWLPDRLKGFGLVALLIVELTSANCGGL